MLFAVASQQLLRAPICLRPVGTEAIPSPSLTVPPLAVAKWKSNFLTSQHHGVATVGHVMSTTATGKAGDSGRRCRRQDKG